VPGGDRRRIEFAAVAAAIHHPDAASGAGRRQARTAARISAFSETTSGALCE
jgi:hypothetical protein